jgi:hypothetical protein
MLRIKNLIVYSIELLFLEMSWKSLENSKSNYVIKYTNIHAHACYKVLIPIHHGIRNADHGLIGCT